MPDLPSSESPNAVPRPPNLTASRLRHDGEEVVAATSSTLTNIAATQVVRCETYRRSCLHSFPAAALLLAAGGPLGAPIAERAAAMR